MNMTLTVKRSKNPNYFSYRNAVPQLILPAFSSVVG